MRFLYALFALLVSQIGQAALLNLPAETGAPVDEDDWSIPLHRCLRSHDAGVGVYDGAERCAVEFAVPLEAGRRLLRVRALYEDPGLTSQFSMQVVARDAVTGGNVPLAAGSDNAAGIIELESLTLAPNYLLAGHVAAFVRVEVRGDTLLKTMTLEYK